MSDPAAEWGKAFSLHIDIGKQGDAPLVDVDENSTQDTRARSMIQGEYRPVRLYFGERGPAREWIPRALEAGDAISLTGKGKDAPGDVLFFADSFSEGGDAENPYYEGLLSLAGEELTTALTGSDLACLVDVLVESAGSLKAAAQYEVTVRRRVHTDDPPAPIVFPTSGQKYVEASDGKRRIAYLFPDDVWRVLLPVIVDDQPTLTWEEVTE